MFLSLCNALKWWHCICVSNRIILSIIIIDLCLQILGIIKPMFMKNLWSFFLFISYYTLHSISNGWILTLCSRKRIIILASEYKWRFNNATSHLCHKKDKVMYSWFMLIINKEVEETCISLRNKIQKWSLLCK